MSKIKNNQQGFGAIEPILVLVIIIAVAGIGWYVWKSKQNTNTTYNTAANASTVTKTVAKSKVTTASAVDPTTNWTAYSSQQGAFSLRYPTSWVQPTNKDACGPSLFDRTLYLGPDTQSVLKCGSSYFGQINVTSKDGNKSSDYKLGTGYLNIASKQVTVSGVNGQRTTATTSGLSGVGGYIDGTTIIQYVFYTGGKTYVVHYIQAPKGGVPSQDVSSDFDLMVSNTLKFTS